MNRFGDGSGDGDGGGDGDDGDCGVCGGDGTSCQGGRYLWHQVQMIVMILIIWMMIMIMVSVVINVLSVAMIDHCTRENYDSANVMGGSRIKYGYVWL